MQEDHPVMGMSLLALVEAGKVSANDGVLGIIQNIDYRTSCSVAEWLVLATGGPVTLQWFTMGDAVEIRRTVAEVAAKTKNVASGPPPFEPPGGIPR